MRNAALVFALALFFAGSHAAQVDEQLVTKALGKISAQGTMKKVGKLASDELEGRNSGYAGCRKAADFIGEHFKKLGLSPIGDQASYFQTFTFSARGAAPSGQDRGLSGKKDTKKKKKKKKKNKSRRPPQKPLYETPTTRNVVGLLEGSDPELKNEVLIVGAHYDHVGCEGQWNRRSRRGRPKGKDDVWNGADDNASGTAVVMEVAEAFATAGIRPKRSILFILFSAEEHGLFGSKWYCDHPLFPIDKTAAMINLDMVGYKKKRSIEVGGVDHAKGEVLRKAVTKATKRVRNLKTSLRSWAMSGSSDHAPFIKQSIPAIYFFNGVHKDYHTIDDELGCVSGKRMARVAKVVFLTLVELAELQEKPKFVKGPASAAASGRLGISVGGNLSQDEAKKLKLKRGPVGLCTAVLLARQGANPRLVRLTEATPAKAEAVERFAVRYEVELPWVAGRDDDQRRAALEDADVVVSCARAGVQVLSSTLLAACPRLEVAADVNAVPPAGIEGVGVTDDGVALASGALGIGALAIGALKYRVQHGLLERMLSADHAVALDFTDACELAFELAAAAR